MNDIVEELTEIHHSTGRCLRRGSGLKVAFRDNGELLLPRSPTHTKPVSRTQRFKVLSRLPTGSAVTQPSLFIRGLSVTGGACRRTPEPSVLQESRH